MYVCQVIHIPYVCMYSMCSAKCVHKEVSNLISQIKAKILLCSLAYYTIRILMYNSAIQSNIT